MDFLKKSLAPISSKAWEEIEEEARDTFKAVLTGRRFVDIEGPKGWDFSAVTLGTLDIPAKQGKGAQYGIRNVRPLVELRVPFTLQAWELDNLSRGAEDVDLDPVVEAAREFAQFEEDAIYKGLKKANIKGLENDTEHPTVAYPNKTAELPLALSKALTLFAAEGVEGPYALVLPPVQWQELTGHVSGYPLIKEIERQLEGSVCFGPYVRDAFLISKRGGDFRLTLGQDVSIGYHSHTEKEVTLYFTESFTFQVIDPAAVIVMKTNGGTK